MSLLGRSAQTLAVVAALWVSACTQPLVIRSERGATVQQVLPSKTVVFVHGMFMTPLCWEK